MNNVFVDIYYLMLELKENKAINNDIRTRIDLLLGTMESCIKREEKELEEQMEKNRQCAELLELIKKGAKDYE